MFNDPKFKNENFENGHEAFILLKPFHNLFAINFSVVETVCCLPIINSCFCIIFVLVYKEILK